MGTILFACVAICFLLFTCFLFLVGIILVRREQHFGRRACSAQGVIIDLKVRVRLKRKRGGGTRSSSSYHPVVQFQREDGLLAGQQVTCELPTGSYPPFYSVGTQIPILYDPSNPMLVQINTFRWRWLGLCVWFMLSLLSLLMGIGMLLSTVSRTLHP
jgi:Protein of unknown function (DUF3592)